MCGEYRVTQFYSEQVSVNPAANHASVIISDTCIAGPKASSYFDFGLTALAIYRDPHFSLSLVYNSLSS